MKILHLEFDQYPAEAITALKQLGSVVQATCSTQEELYEELRNNQYDTIFTRLGLMLDKQCMQLQPGLKYIVTSTTGLNHIDVTYAENNNIRVVSLKGETEFLNNIKSTAEHTWALLLSLVRNMKASTTDVLQGNWNRVPFLCDELDGKKLGIIGFGRLGQIVARYGVAFGMKVLAHDRNGEKYALNPEVIPSSLDTLLSESDYLLLMISWSPENEGFMNADKLSRMKPGSYFINTSRGELVNEADLLTVLKSKKIKGAALDVLTNDSAWSGKTEGSEELLDYARQNNNLIITPHTGGFGKESIARTRNFVTQKLIKEISNA